MTVAVTSLMSPRLRLLRVQEWQDQSWFQGHSVPVIYAVWVVQAGPLLKRQITLRVLWSPVREKPFPVVIMRASALASDSKLICNSGWRWVWVCPRRNCYNIRTSAIP
jgi:hypothetical protein